MKVNQLKVKQLGNGGGFDFDKTNSAFIIKQGYTQILFDCGFNIMDRLKQDDVDIENINYVFISHTDEDHIGNLKMFIYWRYFMFGKLTNVICNRNIEDEIRNYLKYMSSELVGCQNTPADMFVIITTFYKEHIKIDNIDITLTPCFHGIIPTSGAIFNWNDNGNYNYDISVFISADTKANKQIEELTKDCNLIYHDFSNWDFVTRNVHACKTDFELEYSEEYRNKAIKYHTGLEDFNSDWIDV